VEDLAARACWHNIRLINSRKQPARDFKCLPKIISEGFCFDRFNSFKQARPPFRTVHFSAFGLFLELILCSVYSVNSSF
jgi:hypothetical protein